MMSLKMMCAGEMLELFAAKAVFWVRAKTLLAADVHLGKPSAFRHAGIPVPEQITEADLQRLTSLLVLTRAERLVVLGDLFHARTGQSQATLRAFVDWRNNHSALQIDLLIGNHDLKSGPFPGEWNIRVWETLCEKPFLFAHQPAKATGHFGLFGHVHPAVNCGGLRLPCFHFSSQRAVLPAFGSFTGTHRITPARRDHIFAINDGEIAELAPLLFKQGR